jgi:hypothetical protein
MIDGRGDPNTSADYQEAVQALFTLSYWLKFAVKRSGGGEYKVAPLEGLWWSKDMASFEQQDKSAWYWTALIRQPDEVTGDLFSRAVEEVTRKKGLPAVAKAGLESFTEGRAAQILHVGPYSAEGPTIAALHRFIAEQGYQFEGSSQKHHEIYLGDPRRTAPERLRTIIRQAVTPVG